MCTVVISKNMQWVWSRRSLRGIMLQHNLLVSFPPLESARVTESNDQTTDTELEYVKLNPTYAMQAAKKRHAGG